MPLWRNKCASIPFCIIFYCWWKYKLLKTNKYFKRSGWETKYYFTWPNTKDISIVLITMLTSTVSSVAKTWWTMVYNWQIIYVKNFNLFWTHFALFLYHFETFQSFLHYCVLNIHLSIHFDPFPTVSTHFNPVRIRFFKSGIILLASIMSYSNRLSPWPPFIPF